MGELGELEDHHADFDKRNVRVVAISQDDLKNSKKTQRELPHLQIVSDVDHSIADALEINDPGNGRGGQDTNLPTTILVDGAGTVRWILRLERLQTGLTPKELIQVIDRHLPGMRS